MKEKLLGRLSPANILDWADDQCGHPSRLYCSLHSLCRIVLITIQEFRKNDLSLRAASLTFTVLLSLVPILAMSTAVVKGLGGGNQLKKVVYSYVETLESSSPASQKEEGGGQPQTESEDGSDLTSHLYSAVDKVFDYVARTNFATLGTFGVAGMILSVVLVLGNIEMAMNTIWNVESGRSVLRKISDYLALLVLAPLSLNVGLAAGTVLKSDALMSRLSILLPMTWILPVILKLLPIFFLSLTLYVIYLFFPNTRVKNIPALAGALFAGFFWFQVQNLYISLQVGVANYNAIYGSFATLPLFLVWIYFGWVFILAGAQVAYACQHRDSYRLSEHSPTPSLKLSAAYDLLLYIASRFENEEPATLDDFRHSYPMYRTQLVDDIVDQLASHNLLHRRQSDLSLMPSVPKEKLHHQKIVNAVFGSNFSDTPGGEFSRCALEKAADDDTL